MAEDDSVYTKLYAKLSQCWQQLEEVDSFVLATEDVIKSDIVDEKDVKENSLILNHLSSDLQRTLEKVCKTSVFFQTFFNPYFLLFYVF